MHVEEFQVFSTWKMSSSPLRPLLHFQKDLCPPPPTSSHPPPTKVKQRTYLQGVKVSAERQSWHSTHKQLSCTLLTPALRVCKTWAVDLFLDVVWIISRASHWPAKPIRCLSNWPTGIFFKFSFGTTHLMYCKYKKGWKWMVAYVN